MLIFSCRSQKPIAGEKKNGVEDRDHSLISILEKRTHKFHTLKAQRVEVEYHMNGVSEKIRGNIAIYRDSLIAVSIIPALGYEMMRILCTEDSVIIINRQKKSYSATSYNYYRKKYRIPVDFKDLQAILSNEVFYYKEGFDGRVFEKQLKTKTNRNLFIIDAFREGEKITNQGIELDNEGKKLENISISDYDTRMRMNIKYEEFSGYGEILYPKKLRIDLIESNNTIKLYIQYGKIVFNDSINVEFMVPPRYTRGDI